MPGRKCEPGCDCARHNPVHRSDCSCPRCNPKAKVIPISRKKLPGEPRKNANPHMCWCGHSDFVHDLFGCTVCAAKGKKCQAFHSKTEFRDMGSKLKRYAEQVKAEGFINHNGELATCTQCWGTVKLGDPQSISSVISARAHNQSYHSYPRESTRPNRVDGVG